MPTENEQQAALFQSEAEPERNGETPEGNGHMPVNNGHKIVIIDGHALAFRSYFAIRELTNSKGVSTNAVYGFLRSLLRILKEEGEHDATVVAFDAPAKTFRHEQFEDYKAGRAPAPEDLPRQIRTIKEIVELLGLHQIEVPGLEADDLMGTIAKRCEAQGYSVEIVTSDRDAYQLVSERICVRGLDKTDRFGPAEVLEKYGVRVDQWTDYRALTGDSSDNIPGAKGIGPVSARKLLQRYETLDWILEHLDEVEPEAYAKKVRDSFEDVKFSRTLSQIITDADISIDPEGWAQREMAREQLKEVLQELEFGSILRELELTNPEDAKVYRNVRWEDMFYGGSVGFVLSDISAMHAELSELAVASAGGVAVTRDETQQRELFESTFDLDACDAKALSVYARKLGYRLTPGDDPLLMAYVLDPNTGDPETVARRYGAGEWGRDARSRAIATAELLKTLPGRLQGRQCELYEGLERPFSRVLVEMEYAGIRVDTAFLQAQSEVLGRTLQGLEQRVREIADDPDLNLNSRDQLADLLFQKLELQAGHKTSTGKRSTAVAALEPLRDEHPVVGMILEYRELSKLKSTYLDPLPKLVHPDTGRIHTTFNQTVTATGRLSSTNPNLQNIPVRTDIGRQIRRAFIADEGAKLLVADYSQIELRILAHVTEEPVLVEAFREREDIHRRTAAQIYGVDLDEVHSDMRRMAKIINFGVLYGMSAHRLTREIGVSFEEADLFIKTYFERYPSVREYIETTLEAARKQGYVETLLGRRRYIPDIHAKGRNQREYAERTAYNMPIQGTSADIMKLAMIGLSPKLEEYGAKLLLQVHDELVIEVPEAKANEVAELTKETMQRAYRLSVPLVAEVGVGENWLEAK